MKKVLQGNVQHDVRVTALKGVGYGVRVFVDGKLNQQGVAATRDQIGPVARDLLRFEDKCGNLSELASAARRRLNGRDQTLKTNGTS
jgi:hypothetical protein